MQKVVMEEDLDQDHIMDYQVKFASKITIKMEVLYA